MKKILVTGVGGPTPRSFVRAVKWFGGNYKNDFEFIGTDSNPLAYGLYDKDLFAASYVIPRADSSEYWKKINEIIDKHGIDAAIILPEVEVLEWSKNHHRLTRTIKLHLPHPLLAEQLVNKHLLHSILKDTDFIPLFTRLNLKIIHLSKQLGSSFWVRSTEGSKG